MSRQLLSFRQPLHPEAAHRIPFRKVSDEYTTPVCRLHHRDLPRYGDEASWGAGVGIDPLPIALEPWRRSRRNSTLKEGSVTNVWARPSMSATVRPLSDIEFKMLLRRMGSPFTAHGFRRSFRDWPGNETHFARELFEHAFAHVNCDKAELAYRRSDALARRRELMDAWGGITRAASARMW